MSKLPNPPIQVTLQQEVASVTTSNATQWLTTKEAAAYAKTAVSTFRMWGLTKYRPNKHNLYRRADIDAYIEHFPYCSDIALLAALEPQRHALSTTSKGKR